MEVDRLFEVIRTLQGHGAAVLFISHRLEEVFAICQRVTVMRDGRHARTDSLEGLTSADLVRAMVGRELAERPPEAGAGTPGEPVLSVERLTREGVFTDISLTVRSGEIVALSGLVGAGRSEVARAGSRNSLLCQLTADACGLPVIAGPAEATALGNVLVQARALGAAPGSLPELRALLRSCVELRRYEPDGDRRDWAAAARRAGHV